MSEAFLQHRSDNANAIPISVLAHNQPSAMMLIHPSRPASDQSSTFFSACRQVSGKLHFWLGEKLEIQSMKRLSCPLPERSEGKFRVGF